MRDPKRIPVLLKEFEKEWMKHPDMRFGQLVYCFCTGDSIPHIEDDKMLERIVDFESRMQKIERSGRKLNLELFDELTPLDYSECLLPGEIFNNPWAWESNYIMEMEIKVSDILQNNNVFSSNEYIAAKKWSKATYEEKSAFAELMRDMWVHRIQSEENEECQ